MSGSTFVVVILDQFALPSERVEIRGPYPDADQAEQARRRHHLDMALGSPFHRAKTYVREVIQ